MIANTIFSPEQISKLDKDHIPHHVAIIPDGNRRWAKKQSHIYHEGHRVGASIFTDIVRAGKELGVKALTIYAFSTENWNRSKEEIAALMWILQEFLEEQTPEMQKNGVKYNTIGDLTALPVELQRRIQETKKATAHCKQIDMIMALNYGGRDEIRRSVSSIIEDYDQQKIQKEQVTESLISKYLDTAPWGDPDLLIRTSGEFRISNFLIWQLSYTEIYITDILWPDFTPNDFLDAIVDFQKRDRRLGGT